MCRMIRFSEENVASKGTNTYISAVMYKIRTDWSPFFANFPVFLLVANKNTRKLAKKETQIFIW